MSNVREVRSVDQADQEDVFFGQTVLLWARWSVIVAGIVLVLWTSHSIGDLSKTLLAIVPERTRETRKKRRRSVVTHAPKGLLAVFH